MAMTLAHQAGPLLEMRLDDPIGPVQFVVDGAQIRARIDGVETLIVESTVGDPCVTATAETTWPVDDALSATRRVDTFELCRDRGLVSRERVTTFPSGSRRQHWVAAP